MKFFQNSSIPQINPSLCKIKNNTILNSYLDLRTNFLPISQKNLSIDSLSSLPPSKIDRSITKIPNDWNLNYFPPVSSKWNTKENRFSNAVVHRGFVQRKREVGEKTIERIVAWPGCVPNSFHSHRPYPSGLTVVDASSVFSSFSKAPNRTFGSESILFLWLPITILYPP